MTFVSFPIARLRNPVNPPRSVFLITLLLPEDDTSGVIPRHTMLRHAYHVSATRNFRLTPTTQPTQLRDLRPLPPHPSYASPPICVPHHALARRAPERSEEARQPSACRLPIRARPIPTHWFHVKHERTDRSMRMVFDMRPGCPLLRRGLRRLRCAPTPAPPAPITGIVDSSEAPHIPPAPPFKPECDEAHLIFLPSRP